MFIVGIQRLLATAAMVLACGTLSALPTVAAESWRMYIYLPSPTMNTAQGMAKMLERIEKESKGELTIRLQLGGTLQIQATNITGAVGDGIVQMGDDAFYQGSIPFAGVIRLPMLIQTEEEFVKAQEILRPYLEAAYAKKGVLLLSQYAYPAQVAWSRTKLTSPQDMQGQRLRVTAPEQGEFVRRFGAIPVTLGTPEISSSLDRGVIDGVFTSSAPGAWSWREALKFNYRLTIGYFDSNMIVNEQAFQKLSPATQEIVRRVAKETAPSLTEVMQRDDEVALDKLKSQLTVTIPTADDIKSVTAEMAPFWESWAKANGSEATEILAKIRAAVGR